MTQLCSDSKIPTEPHLGLHVTGSSVWPSDFPFLYRVGKQKELHIKSFKTQSYLLPTPTINPIRTLASLLLVFFFFPCVDMKHSDARAI